jgi:hypothetical protein
MDARTKIVIHTNTPQAGGVFVSVALDYFELNLNAYNQAKSRRSCCKIV